MADEFRAQREAAKARQAIEQARAAAKPDVLTALPQFLQEEYGLSKDEAALALRNGIFTLFPDDAPIEHRQQLWEAQQARKERAAQAEREHQAIQQYRYQCELAARGATEDLYPDSVAFYDGNHARYARALEKKALDLAADAQQRGVRVDVSPAAVQRALEQDLAERLNKTQQKRANRNKPAEPAPTATTSQSVASNVRTSAQAPTQAPRTGKKTLAEADAEIMALLQSELRR